MQESEREFQSWVIATAEAHGWRVWHAPTPMRPIGGNKFVPDPRGRGLPDLFLIHDDPPRMILAEVKKEGGMLSAAQEEFLHLAREVAFRTTATRWMGGTTQSDEYQPVKVFVWKPANRDLIEATLRGADINQ